MENGLDLQKLFAMQAQLKKNNPPLEGIGQEIIEVAYLKHDGSRDVRPLRLNIPKDAKKPMPLVYVPHYEMKEDSLEIRDYLLKGWAVASCADFKDDKLRALKTWNTVKRLTVCDVNGVMLNNILWT